MTQALRCLLLLAAANAAWALDPARALSQYHRRNWQVEDGLPRNYIMSVASSGDGYLLVGSDEGLTRFDGVRFRPFDPDPALGLSRRWIGSLIATRGDALWIGTFDGWIYEWRDGKVTTRFNVCATVFALLEDAQGGIWASTRGGVVRRAGSGFQPVPGLARPPRNGLERPRARPPRRRLDRHHGRPLPEQRRKRRNGRSRPRQPLPLRPAPPRRAGPLRSPLARRLPRPLPSPAK